MTANQPSLVRLDKMRNAARSNGPWQRSRQWRERALYYSNSPFSKLNPYFKMRSGGKWASRPPTQHPTTDASSHPNELLRSLRRWKFISNSSECGNSPRNGVSIPVHLGKTENFTGECSISAKSSKLLFFPIFSICISPERKTGRTKGDFAYWNIDGGEFVQKISLFMYHYTCSRRRHLTAPAMDAAALTSITLEWGDGMLPIRVYPEPGYNAKHFRCEISPSNSHHSRVRVNPRPTHATSFGNTLKWFQVFYHSVFSLLLRARCAEMRNVFSSSIFARWQRWLRDDSHKNSKRISNFAMGAKGRWSEFLSSLWLTDSQIMLLSFLFSHRALINSIWRELENTFTGACVVVVGRRTFGKLLRVNFVILFS